MVAGLSLAERMSGREGAYAILDEFPSSIFSISNRLSASIGNCLTKA
jgi:hypothetical protein